jgi:hypothetical protein
LDSRERSGSPQILDFRPAGHRWFEKASKGFFGPSERHNARELNSIGRRSSLPFPASRLVFCHRPKPYIYVDPAQFPGLSPVLTERDAMNASVAANVVEPPPHLPKLLSRIIFAMLFLT